MQVEPRLTTSAVNRAGRVLRHWMQDRLELDDPKLAPAWDVVLEYRAAHQYPLTKATMGLRSMVRSEGLPVEVSQRLKRISTIMDKLRREPTMGLATMQDIGGCRAVLNSVDQVRAVEHRLKKNRPALHYYDYITSPRPSGYRGVHVVVCYPDASGVDREIEVQLRTKTMHEWAIAVERLAGRIQDDLKSGRGPKPLLELLATISEAMAMEERGQQVPSELIERMTKLRASALPYMGPSHP
jgi:putative GTP pyrophosphokinase